MKLHLLAAAALAAATTMPAQAVLADIRSIAFKGVGVVADNLSFTTPVPEPESYALMMAGLAALGLMVSRRRKPD